MFSVVVVVEASLSIARSRPRGEDKDDDDDVCEMVAVPSLILMGVAISAAETGGGTAFMTVVVVVVAAARRRVMEEGKTKASLGLGMEARSNNAGRRRDSMRVVAGRFVHSAGLLIF